MNNEMLQGKWKQVRGAVKAWWEKPAGDDLDQVVGPEEKLIGFLQERYGCGREQARAEVDLRLAEYKATRAQ